MTGLFFAVCFVVVCNMFLLLQTNLVATYHLLSAARGTQFKHLYIWLLGELSRL